MKHNRFKSIITVLIIIVLSMSLISSSYAEPGYTVVYRTKTGECYHREGCRNLKSKIEVTLYDAVNVYGLRACSICNPPTLDESTSKSSSIHKNISNTNDDLGNKDNNSAIVWAIFIILAIVAFISIWCSKNSKINQKKVEENDKEKNCSNNSNQTNIDLYRHYWKDLYYSIDKKEDSDPYLKSENATLKRIQAEELEEDFFLGRPRWSSYNR